MARKQLKLTISDDGRDKGKVFVLTEMAARPGHAWATRALFAIMNAGVDIPENFMGAGWAAIAAVGLKALGAVNVDAAMPLMDELLQCVEIMPDPAKPAVVRLPIDDDFEEIKTIFQLQKEALLLHVNFPMTAAPSISDPAAVPETAA